MIPEKSKNLIKEEMLTLPKEAQDAINSLDWEKISEEIGKKYLLNDGEIETFQLETASFLLGLVDEDAYLTDIESEVGTSKAEAEKIAEEANQKIFTPIYNTLEENIKKNLPSRKSTPEQNLNFILSGGDYMAFLEEREPLSTQSEWSGGGGEVKQTNKNTSLPAGPRKMTDIRSKFTI